MPFKPKDGYVNLETLARLNGVRYLNAPAEQSDSIIKYMESDQLWRLYFHLKFIAGVAKDIGYSLFVKPYK